jgi:hypothetical protein
MGTDTHKQRPVRWAYVLGLCFISIMAGMGFTIVYFKHAQDQQAAMTAAQRREYTDNICTVIDKLHKKYDTLNTPGAAGVADVWANLYVLIGCQQLK